MEKSNFDEAFLFKKIWNNLFVFKLKLDNVLFIDIGAIQIYQDWF